MWSHLWVVSQSVTHAGSRRNVDRWANPHHKSRRPREAKLEPGSTRMRTEHQDNRRHLLIERREAWNTEG